MAGSNLSSSNTNTANGILINETSLHVPGFQNPQDAIGKNVTWNDKLVPVRGVVVDFNQKSLYEPIKPLIIASEPPNNVLVNLLLQPKNANASGVQNQITVGNSSISCICLF